MAQATNTTAGEIVLGGDLFGDANLPELRASGVTPGTYAPVHRLYVDSKGRITSVGQVTSAEVLALLSDATNSTKGIIQVGSNISVSSGIISIGTGSSSAKGLVQVGDNIDVSLGTISVATATTSTKGVAQVGSNISVASGVISVPDASDSTKGVVQVGSGLSVTGGVASIPNATDSTKGIARAGSGLSITSGTLALDSMPDATAGVKGVVQVGSNINVTSGTISVAEGSNSVKGIVQIGSGLTATGSTMSIADATGSTKGVVQVGSGLSVTGGVLSLSTVPDATTSSKGVVQVGQNMDVTSGTISVATATTGVKGLVQVGSGFNVTSGTISVPDATTSSKGVVQIGSGLSVAGGVLSVQDATTSTKGIVQVGNLLSVTGGIVSTSSTNASAVSKGYAQIGSGLAVSSGVISADLPDATSGSKGIVQVGSGFDVSSGTISVATATTGVKGLVQPSTGFSIASGIISGDVSSTTVFGQVKPGTNMSVVGGVLNLDIADATTSSLGGVIIGSGFTVRTDTTTSIDSDVVFNSTPGKNCLSNAYTGSGTTGVDFVGFDKNVLQTGALCQANVLGDGSITYQLATNSSSQQLLSNGYIQTLLGSAIEIVKVVPFGGYYYILAYNGGSSYTIWRGTSVYALTQVHTFSGLSFVDGRPGASIAATSSAIFVTTGGDSGYRSTNGTTWSLTAIDGSYSFMSIAASSTTFCALSVDGDNYAYSTNGTTWTAVYGGFATTGNEICFGGGRFVVVSSGRVTSAYSTNGSDFFDGGNLPARTGYTAKRVFMMYDGSSFWAAPYGDVWSTSSQNAYKSTDGTTWTAVTLPNPSGTYNNHPQGLGVVSGEVSIVCGHPSGGYTLYYTSNGGSSWSTGNVAYTSYSGTNYVIAIAGSTTTHNVMFDTLSYSRRIKQSIAGVISGADNTDYTANVILPTVNQEAGISFDVFIDAPTRNVTLTFPYSTVHPSTTTTVSIGTKAYYTFVGYSTTGGTIADKWLVMPRTI